MRLTARRHVSLFARLFVPPWQSVGAATAARRLHAGALRPLWRSIGCTSTARRLPWAWWCGVDAASALAMGAIVRHAKNFDRVYGKPNKERENFYP